MFGNRPFVILIRMLPAIALMAGCDGHAPIAAPIAAAVPPASVLVGAWEFAHARNDTCAGANGSDIYSFHIDSTGIRPDGLMEISTTWSDVILPGENWPVDGYMDLATRRVELNFWLVVNLAGQEFDGTLDADDNIAGTLSDPKPGYYPQFVITPCQYVMSGVRTGP